MPLFGHLGIALITKRFSPQVPLWALLIATMFIDIIYFIYPFDPLWWSHSLFMALIWSGIVVGATALTMKYLQSRKKSTIRTRPKACIIQSSLVMEFIVFSHWALDYIGW